MANYQTYKKINGTEAILGNSVGPGQVTGVSTGIAHQFMIWNCCWWDVSNGGCCLAWTVPALTSTVRFELQAGGGSGSIGTCCSNGPAGGAGSYATKTLHQYKGDFVPGSTTYTLCAAGTSECSCCGQCQNCLCCGRRGCSSYVTGGSNLNNFCTEGGAWGWHQCSGGCYTCTSSWQCCVCIATCSRYFGADFGFAGVQGGRQMNQYCMGGDWATTGGGVGPWSAPTHKGVDNCSHGNVHGCCKGHSLFPGGGGMSPFTDGGCCWGGYGAGGLVVVSYWQ